MLKKYFDGLAPLTRFGLKKIVFSVPFMVLAAIIGPFINSGYSGSQTAPWWVNTFTILSFITGMLSTGFLVVGLIEVAD